VDNSLDLSIRLLTPKPILKPSINILEIVIVRGETARNSTYKATPNYNSNTIVINISKVSSKVGNLGLYKYICLT
jgi:hypothetical protein